LSVLGYWHGRQMQEIVVSDVNTAVLPLAQRNLSLLTALGLAERIAELQQLYVTYQKASHAEALASAARFQERHQRYLGRHVISTHLFAADVMDRAAIMTGVNGRSIDMVISDIPYGWLTTWHTDDVNKSLVWQMLENLRFVLSPAAVVAIAADKQQKVAHEGYERLDKFQVGKRRVWIGRPL
jgi:tRNA G10  N-methylase Trm11